METISDRGTAGASWPRLCSLHVCPIQDLGLDTKKLECRFCLFATDFRGRVSVLMAISQFDVLIPKLKVCIEETREKRYVVE